MNMGMNMKMRFRRLHWQELVIFFFVIPLLFAGPARAGDYLLSAHGSATTTTTGYGVLRLTGYARGNCAHCHEQHASINGTEPVPPTLISGAEPYMLFALNFDKTKKTGPYSEVDGDDFCFYCHSGTSASVQQVTNHDYSYGFGCGTTSSTIFGTGPSDIMAAFNQTSYHNLYDIWKFVFYDGNFSWFTSSSDSNPCNACHNPHLARRNCSAPKDVTLSVMSRPSDHFALWGTTATIANPQTMYSVYGNGTQYESPYCSGGLSTDREPAKSTSTTADPAAEKNTPDYVALCTDCHNKSSNIYSSTISGGPRTLLPIDWSTGDQHGAFFAGTGTRALKPPYSSGSQTSFPYYIQNTTNYVLSCLDCHEPHGSPNITLLRRRVNGGDLVGAITTAALPDPPGTGTNNSNRELGYLCMRCHQQDNSTVSATIPPKWENVHHGVTNRPYFRGGRCACHGGRGPWWKPIACDKCHFHGGTDAWLGSRATGRKTF